MAIQLLRIWWSRPVRKKGRPKLRWRDKVEEDRLGKGTEKKKRGRPVSKISARGGSPRIRKVGGCAVHQIIEI
jgi:hypothetical protein